MKNRPYATLAAALTVHFVIMWALTYIGVAAFEHIFLNANRLYMAIVMVAPMAIVMLAAMRHMFPNKRLNLGIHISAAIVFVAAFSAIRGQLFVGDAQLSRSMIPHHSMQSRTVSAQTCKTRNPSNCASRSSRRNVRRSHR